MERLTERLRLVPIGPEHADELHRLHSDPDVAEWYALTVEEARARAEAWGRGWASDGVSKWLAYDKETGELIGRGGLSFADVDGERRLELGWTVFGSRWGNGYATEIGRAALAFAFDELGAEEVVAFTELANKRSIRVMQRIGMRFEKQFLGHGLVEGKPSLHDDAPFVVYVAERA